MNVKNLEDISKHIRHDILTMSFTAQSAHAGGALSCVEILVSLYFKLLDINPQKPDMPTRDRVVFSKGHDAKALYAVLARRGYFPLELFKGYEQQNGLLAGHPIRGSLPGIDYSSGSLGHGLPLAVGIALAAKRKKEQWNTIVIISDGELNEGTTWESFLFAAHHKLDNLLVIIDENKLQGFGYTKDVLNTYPLSSKLKSFGCNVITVNGHSYAQLEKAYRSFQHTMDKPTVIRAKTIKGKGGVPQHINQISSQYKAPTEKEYTALLKKL